MDERQRYAEFIGEVHGHEPFPWQADLAERLVAGDIPPVIDVPTGLGKTRVIATWAYALGRQLEKEGIRSLPLRLNFVVDRRIIVDAASTDGDMLASAFGIGHGPVVSTIGAALARFTGTPLQVTAMRGGRTWDAVWLDRPDQPTLVVGTIDQFGSRLLFRGYGTSSRLRPIDAALVGTDSWLVIDEAHISEALVKTSISVARHQGDRPLRVTQMSATAEEEPLALTARLEAQTSSEEFPSAAEVAKLRLEVSKPARLVEFSYQIGSAKTWRTKVSAIGRDLADLAVAHATPESITAVVCNTIASARAVHENLVGAGHQAVLLIGRCREYEKSRTLREWLPRIALGSADRASDLFVVATQTIEVGADLDFDVLVTEAAPLSSLIQRFGRVNRAGAREPATSAIVYVPVAHDEDPVYGGATSATWRFLCEETSVAVVQDKKDVAGAAGNDAGLIDFGVRSSQDRRQRALGRGLEPEHRFVPVAIGSHFERWAMTSPAPLQDVDPDPFLRGVERPRPEVSVTWRVPPPGLSPDDSPGAVARRWAGWLSLQPPRNAEEVDVPIYELKNLLAVGKPLPVGDVGGLISEQIPDETTNDTVVGVVWLGDDQLPLLLTRSGLVQPADTEGVARQIRPGDCLILVPEVGGHDEWGWTGRPGVPVLDVGDIDTRVPAQALPTWRSSVRADPRVWRSFLPESAIHELSELIAGFETDGEGKLDRIVEILDTSIDRSPIGRARAGLRSFLLGEHEDSPLAYVIDLPRLPGNTVSKEGVDPSVLSVITDDSEEGSSLVTTAEPTALPTIYSHGRSVGANAREFATNLGLPNELVEAVGMAGEWHDLGKADGRFQAMLAGGDHLRALQAPEPIAKSGIDARSYEARRMARLARVPRGFRHEAVSARIVDELIGRGAVPDEVDAELLRHLVVSHHGHARPLLPPLLDPAAPEVEVMIKGSAVHIDGATKQVDWDQPSRFALLHERYGWWGLAMLETIVRLADMKASKEGR